MLYVDPEILELATFYANKHNVALETILAMGIQESGLNPFAVGDAARSIGAMQISLDGAGFGMNDWMLFNLAFNFEVACRFYAQCCAATRTREDAVSAYNQGIASWQAYGLERNRNYWEPVCALHDDIVSEGFTAKTLPTYLSWVPAR